MRSYSVCKLIPPTVLSFRIVTKHRVIVYVLNIFVGSLSPAFRKIIRLEKTCMNVFPGFSRVQNPRSSTPTCNPMGLTCPRTPLQPHPWHTRSFWLRQELRVPLWVYNILLYGCWLLKIKTETNVNLYAQPQNDSCVCKYFAIYWRTKALRPILK